MSRKKQTYNPCDDCQYSYSRNGQESGMCKKCEFTYFKDRKQSENVIELPCKVGDTVYVPWRWAFQQGVATVRIEEIKFYDSQMHYMFFIDMESDNECFNQSFGGWKLGKSIGVSVFLTKEEAEKALAKMKGGAE